MAGEKESELYDVPEFRVDPMELDEGDVVVFKVPGRNTVPAPLGVVDGVDRPSSVPGECVVSFCCGGTASWNVGDDPSGEPKTIGHAIRVPRRELCEMMKRGREWVIEPGFFAPPEGDEPDRHPFDIESRRANPAELEQGEFVVRAPPGVEPPGFEVYRVAETDVGDDPNRWALRMCCGVVASWEMESSAGGGGREVDGIAVRVWEHEMSLLIGWGFQTLPDHGPDHPTCPRCGHFHVPGEPCA